MVHESVSRVGTTIQENGEVIILEVAVHRWTGRVKPHTGRFLCLNQADGIVLEPLCL